MKKLIAGIALALSMGAHAQYELTTPPPNPEWHRQEVSVPEGMEVRLVPVGTPETCVAVTAVKLQKTSCDDPQYDFYDLDKDGVTKDGCRYDPCNPSVPWICPN